jgi:hypothetical protein
MRRPGLARPILALLCLAGACERPAGDRPSSRVAPATSDSPAASRVTRSRPTSIAQLTDPCAADPAPECARGSEREALQTAVTYLRRSGDTLTIVRRGLGGSIRLVDDTTEGDGYVRYRYLGVLPALETDLVEASMYEDVAYLAIHRASGDTLWLDAIPVIAPGLRRFAVASADNVAGYLANRLTIVLVRPEGLSREWQRETGDYGEGTGWGPTDLVWRDSTVVEFHEQPVSDTTPPRNGRLAHRDGAWHLEELQTRR